MDANCNLQIPEVPGLQPQQLTVGRHFYFKCHLTNEGFGDFDFTKATLQLPSDQSYQLVATKVEARNEKEFDLDVVSYVPGEASFSQISLFDGTKTISLEVSKIKVDSVIVTEQGQPSPEPYGYQIQNIPWPHAYTALGVLLLGITIYMCFYWYKKQSRLKKLMNEMNQFHSVIPADSQFYRSLRRLEKQKEISTSELEKIFITYLVRTYRIPFHGMTIKEADQVFKKMWPLLKSERRELIHTLMDFKSMKEKSALITALDFQNYIKKLYRFVDVSEQKTKKLTGDVK